MSEQTERRWLKYACELAFHCSSVDTAYNVGAVIVGPSPCSPTSVDKQTQKQIIATGFSRELPGNTHAEECALIKAESPVEGYTLYSSMEPCEYRLSGKKPCVDRIIEAKIGKVVLAAREPTLFVKNCRGVEKLKCAGIEVEAVDDDELHAMVKEANKHLPKE